MAVMENTNRWTYSFLQVARGALYSGTWGFESTRQSTAGSPPVQASLAAPACGNLQETLGSPPMRIWTVCCDLTAISAKAVLQWQLVATLTVCLWSGRSAAGVSAAGVYGGRLWAGFDFVATTLGGLPAGSIAPHSAGLF